MINLRWFRTSPDAAPELQYRHVNVVKDARGALRVGDPQWSEWKTAPAITERPTVTDTAAPAGGSKAKPRQD